MTSCPSCGEPQTIELGEGVVHRCESDECHELYWIFENQSFVVPNLVIDQHSQVQGFSKATTMTNAVGLTNIPFSFLA